MTWWNGFARSVAFAALAAAACPLYLAFAGLLLGWKLAMATFVVGATSLYALGIARQPVLGLAAAGAVGFAGFTLLVFGASGVALVVAMAALLGVLRSGLLCREQRSGAGGFARRLAIEAALLGAGLALAHHFGRGAVAPEALAVWGFFLIQSAFFLIGGPAAEAARRAGDATTGGDPFERALRRATAVLDETA